MSESIPLQEFCRIVQGGRHGLSGNDFVPNGYPAYGAGGINGDLSSYEFDEPAVVLSAIGARCGKCFFADGKWTSLANTQLIFPEEDRADAKFLWYQLNDERRWHRSGTGQPFIKPSDVKRHHVYLPPLPEQRRIAGILDRADALRAKRRAALAQLETLTQSIFLDMFGDPSTNPKGWPLRALEEVFEIARGGSPRPIDDYITASPNGVNWIMIGDAPEGAKYITGTKKKIKPEGAKRSRSVQPGDLLLTNSMSFGRPYIMRTSGCIHDGWLVLSPSDEAVIPDYFYSLLGSRAIYAEFSRRAPGATVKNLNIDLVKSVVVPVPPRESQQEYARRVAAVESAAVPFQQSRDKLDSLFTALQHMAFQGHL